MNSVVLFDTERARKSLLPFTYTRPLAEIRVGINTITEKWERWFDEVSFCTEPYLAGKYKQRPGRALYVRGNIIPNAEFVGLLKSLQSGHAISHNNEIVAFTALEDVSYTSIPEIKTEEVERIKLDSIDNPWDIFAKNESEIRSDFMEITKGRISQEIEDPHTVVYGKENLFIEEGAVIRAAVINAEKGPVYIGKKAMVHEGSIIAGAFALCEGAHVNMGAKVKGDSTVGPYSKVGGEVSNSVIFGYSNKGHDGFLGNSVIGEWCNIGADTNTSNLKNNYASVKLWNYDKGGFKDTGLQFCGLMMGDHSKCGINTMFNTGTVVGVNSNIFGSGFPRNFIPSYAWGGANGFITYQTRKAFEVAEVVMKRRDRELTPEDELILTEVFKRSAEYRIWEKK